MFYWFRKKKKDDIIDNVMRGIENDISIVNHITATIKQTGEELLKGDIDFLNQERQRQDITCNHLDICHSDFN